MKLRIERTDFWEATIGELFVNGQEECFTLEDEEREIEGQPVEAWKVSGKTAIRRGIYPVTINYSNRFKRDLPILGGVEGFEGVRIHPGNTAEDTEGCILVGRGKTSRTVTESKVAFNALFAKIKQALDDGDRVEIEIV